MITIENRYVLVVAVVGVVGDEEVESSDCGVLSGGQLLVGSVGVDEEDTNVGDRLR